MCSTQHVCAEMRLPCHEVWRGDQLQQVPLVVAVGVQRLRVGQRNVQPSDVVLADHELVAAARHVLLGSQDPINLGVAVAARLTAEHLFFSPLMIYRRGACWSIVLSAYHDLLKRQGTGRQTHTRALMRLLPEPAAMSTTARPWLCHMHAGMAATPALST